MMALETSTPHLIDRLPRPRGRLTADAPLGPQTWFRAGGAAEVLFRPADVEDLAKFMAALPADVPVTVLGVGSNILLRDGGVRGVVIRLLRGFTGILVEGHEILAGAGALDLNVALTARDHGLAGLEFLSGIPGTIGGALRMNAGANGVETRERVVSVRAIDRKGELHVLSDADMGYACRHSSAPKDLVFTFAEFEGDPAGKDEIKAAMDAVQHHRETVQPIREKTGGSTFKNPPGTSAWKEIDKAGCRGLQIGGAQMSPMHCNFMINIGNATGYDLEFLGETVRARVLENSGIRLEWEIKRLGRFKPGHEVDEFLGQLL